ncbi:hypothetical protein [Novosphingopyxis iocasae]|uniref:hypothetical protein n=1 Tax=Novosphingopyxis iocasae TaxID=2762729 RepID=UPI00165127F6|nr:hypothetical protein [Novosphingopyxis iocasae]
MSVILLGLLGTGLVSVTPDTKLFIAASQAFQQAVGGADHSVRALFEVSVDPHGRSYDCRLLESDNAVRAIKACPRLKRLKLAPARSGDGSKTYGTLLLPLRFSSAEIERKEGPGKPMYQQTVMATVSEMPEDVSDPYPVHLSVAFDTSGAVTDCEAKEDGIDERFIRAACTMVSGATAQVLKDASGEPVAYVATRSFVFGSDRAEPMAITTAPLRH